MSNSYEHGIDSNHPAWYDLNLIANTLGADYTLKGIYLAAQEVMRQQTTKPRDTYTDDSPFGSFGDLTQHRSMVVYATKYAEQNIRELPNIWELHGCHSGMGNPVRGNGLGAIWYYGDWLRSLRPYVKQARREGDFRIMDRKVDKDLYMDSDPEWKKFINSICKLASQEGLDLILFYWS
jgi:hypothetical protein